LPKWSETIQTHREERGRRDYRAQDQRRIAAKAGLAEMLPDNDFCNYFMKTIKNSFVEVSLES
jgi:hypothetical protein